MSSLRLLALLFGTCLFACGTGVMPQIGLLPGPSRRIAACSGQVEPRAMHAGFLSGRGAMKGRPASLSV